MSIVWPVKTSAEVLDYQIDWTARLAGDTIATSEVTLATAAGLTKDSDTNTTTAVTIWLSGGTAGLVGKLTNTIVTAGGRTMVEEISLPIDILVVEDGSGVAGAESYATLDQADAYCAKNGIAWTGSTVDKNAALRRGTNGIDRIYRNRFPGSRLNGRAQSLEWPRECAFDADGNAIATDEIPIEIVDAAIEAASRELTTPGAMLPDLEIGAQIKSLKAGSVQIDYGGLVRDNPAFQAIDGILAGLLGPAPSPYSAKAARA